MEVQDQTNTSSHDAINSKLYGWLKKHSHLPKTFFDLSKILFNPEISAESLNRLKVYNWWHDDFGFIFLGNAGIGKTLLMKRLCIKALMAHIPYDYKVTQDIQFLPVSNLLKRAKNFESEDSQNILELCLNSKILFLDDLGAENATQFAQEIIFNILDTRCSKSLQTFISSNLTMQEIKEKYSERIQSRIKELCIPVDVKGDDKRNLIMKNRIEQLDSRKYEEQPKVSYEINEENLAKIFQLIKTKDF